MSRFAAVALGVLVLGGCSADQKKSRGEPCELNSECDAPLVCRIGACRIECVTTRDCAAGLQCVLDEMGFGACQLPSELTCAQPSDCPFPLVCASERCVNRCATDRDCPAGARCVIDATGGRGCIDPAARACVRDSECQAMGADLVCGHDQRCREECFSDRECRFGTVCDLADRRCKPLADFLDGGPGIDASLPDAGPDAGGADAGPCPPAGSATVISSGYLFSCAVVLGGQVACWGSNEYGTLGSAPGRGPNPRPRLIPGIATAVDVTAGVFHACAELEDGTAVCWGQNAFGQLGADTAGTPSPTPISVGGLTGVQQIRAGASHTCAIAGPMSQVFCWGSRQGGTLGDGMTTGMSARPVLVPSVPTARSLGIGSSNSCATAGTIYCWGENMNGQVGNGSMFPQPDAAPVGGLSGPVVDMAISHACMLDPMGAATCWGFNLEGELGRPAAPPMAFLPGPVGGLTPAADIQGGDRITCARLVDGAVQCWGWNPSGQLGTGTVGGASTEIPTGPIAGLPPLVDEIAVGHTHVCAREGGEVWCWGDNQTGQLGVDPSVTMARGTAELVPCLP